MSHLDGVWWHLQLQSTEGGNPVSKGQNENKDVTSSTAARRGHSTPDSEIPETEQKLTLNEIQTPRRPKN